MRILVGGFHHESDSFNPIVTDEREIRVTRGMDMVDQRGENSIGGIISKLQEYGYEICGTLFARAVPNGVWKKDAYISLKNEMLSMAMAYGNIDGICLALHGSMLVEEIGDAEKDILVDLRKLFPTTPITAALDMHTSMSIEMLQNCNAFVGYRTAPHVDTFETGERAAELLHGILEEGTSPTMKCIRVPMIMAGEKSESDVFPMTDIMNKAREIESREAVLSASVLMGFPWADNENIPVSALVVTDGNPELAEMYSKELSQEIWKHRKDFVFGSAAYLMEEAIEKGRAKIEKGNTPLVFSDSGDNPTAGGSGDFTAFLKLLMEDPLMSSLNPPLVYQNFYDPDVYYQARNAGKGSIISISLGAKYAPNLSSPLKLEAEVLEVLESYNGFFQGGLCLLRANGIDIVVTEKHVGSYDVAMLRALGVVPEERKAICMKLGYLEPDIKRIAKSHILVLTPGATREDIENIAYRNVDRPVFPLDDGFEFIPEVMEGSCGR